MKAPVLIIGFNRADFFQHCFSRVLDAKPPVIYVHIDGPVTEEDRSAQMKIAELVQESQCGEVKVLYRQLAENFGCGKGVNAAIDWFFEREKLGVILEDDLLPEPDFFRFADEGLSVYESVSGVGQIGGYNPLGSCRFRIRRDSHPTFSPKPYIWGWATWANRWQPYRAGTKISEEQVRRSSLNNIREEIPSVYSEIFLGKKASESGELDTWDYSWAFEFFQERWVCVLPPVSLVKNVGFDTRSTHTRTGASRASRPLPVGFEFTALEAPNFRHERLAHRISVVTRYRTRLKKRSAKAFDTFRFALQKVVSRNSKRSLGSRST